MKDNEFEVIIVGGSYAGLAAALTLGRSLRKVLVIDYGNPCNIQVPYAHNFITHDHREPSKILEQTKAEISKYPTVSFLEEMAIAGEKVENGFQITSISEEVFFAKKLLFATGVLDIMPNLEGFSECWGKSILHCVYCDAYEVKDKKIGVLSRGFGAFITSKVVHHWAKDLKIYSNGPINFSSAEEATIKELGIPIIETPIKTLAHKDGMLQKIIFTNGESVLIDALFTAVHTMQHCEIPMDLGCTLNEDGRIGIDKYGKTNVSGIFAAGDNTRTFRTIATAVASGTTAGVYLNKELIDDLFA